MKGIIVMQGVGARERLSGSNRRHRNNFGSPWQESRERLIGGGHMERVSHSRIWREVGGQVGKLE